MGIVYSKENDTFVYHSRDESESMKVLQQIGDSFKKIDVHLSRSFWPVNSIDEWIDRYAGKINVLPSVLDPELLIKYAPNGLEKSLKTLVLAQTAAYTKHGVQLLWNSQGVPTPHTKYVDMYTTSKDSIESDIHKNFSQYEGVVMNIVDGSGGYATIFSPQDNVGSNLEHDFFQNQRLQIQGALPLITSPGYVANIDTDGSIQELLVSRQIFAEPGAHAGNIWEESYDFDLLDPNFSSANLSAVKALAQTGVVGQVSIDSLIVTAQNAEKYGVAQTTFREANIRPGGSSVINRIRQGSIDGKRITSVLTSTKIPVSKKDVLSGKFENILSQNENPSTVAVMYNYNTETGYACVAIAGADVPTHVLQEQQMEILKKLA